MSKQAEPFSVQNSDWKIQEQTDGSFQLSSSEDSRKIAGLTGRQVSALIAVASETDRHLRSKGG